MEKEDLFENLETDRLLLRKIVDTDAEMLYKNIYNNFEHYKFYYQLLFKDFEEYKPLVEKYKEWYSKGNYFRWAVTLKDTNEVIGIVQLYMKDSLNNNCKISYIISYKYNNKGYGKEAVKEIINFGFNKLHFHRIDANIVNQNEASIKLAESVGMHFESEREDAYKLGEDYYNEKVYTILNK